MEMASISLSYSIIRFTSLHGLCYFLYKISSDSVSVDRQYILNYIFLMHPSCMVQRVCKVKVTVPCLVYSHPAGPRGGHCFTSFL